MLSVPRICTGTCAWSRIVCCTPVDSSLRARQDLRHAAFSTAVVRRCGAGSSQRARLVSTRHNCSLGRVVQKSREFSTVEVPTGATEADDSAREKTEKEVERPSRRNLKNYALHCALPMVGFGFMDNLVMIQVGELIDSSIGVTFGFATMTSAALGQVCSDVSGVCFGGVVDAFFAKIGIPPYYLTPDQLSSQHVRVVRTTAMGIGVMCGCLLGMTSLLFIDLDKADRLKKQKELKTIFKTLAEKGGDLMQCERVGLYILDKDEEHLWTMGRRWSSSSAHGLLDKPKTTTQQVSREQLAGVLRTLQWSEQEINDVLPEDMLTLEEADMFIQGIMGNDETRLPLRPHGTKWLCVKEKRTLNIADVGQDTRFSRSQTIKMMPKAWRAESALVGPVMGEDGKVVGVVEMINKLDPKGRVVSFSMEDERLMKMLCHHCSLFVNNFEFGD
eukprot:GEMP01028541.1.p1 GENE.GEMP01028541.1~~GEMP01028541.1.p1  ORF type:complete len:445 (+),score=59.06 GEMP01028541.1:52-1386(+)